MRLASLFSSGKKVMKRGSPQIPKGWSSKTASNMLFDEGNPDKGAIAAVTQSRNGVAKRLVVSGGAMPSYQ